MNQQDFTTTITVNTSANEAFDNVNRVTRWWTENLNGDSARLNDEFTVQFDDIHLSTQRLIEVVQSKRIVWLVTNSNLSFIKHKQEWNNTKIIFEFSEKGDQTEIRFTHQGLVPTIECFDACSNAWTEYIEDSLVALLNEGKGKPTPKNKVPAK